MFRGCPTQAPSTELETRTSAGLAVLPREPNTGVLCLGIWGSGVWGSGFKPRIEGLRVKAFEVLGFGVQGLGLQVPSLTSHLPIRSTNDGPSSILQHPRHSLDHTKIPSL